MGKLAQLGLDIAKLWSKYSGASICCILNSMSGKRELIQTTILTIQK